MKLQKFRVTDFRSVEDSEWIDVEEITAFIGTNESGKTNLLIPLWKLNPVMDGEINPVADYPRKRYNDIRNMERKPIFIRAQFELSDELAFEIAEMTGTDVGEVKSTVVSRDFDGHYVIDFPNASPVRDLPAAQVITLLEEAHRDIGAMKAATKSEEDLKERILSGLSDNRELVESVSEAPDKYLLSEIKELLEGMDTAKAAKRSIIAPRYGQAIDAVEEMIDTVSKPHPSDVEEVRNAVIDNMPSFVYYANYGNLDSEIYLPHVIQNMQRRDIGSREEAKTRTLRVLFEFVRLLPQEILELGQDPPVTHNGEPTTVNPQKSRFKLWPQRRPKGRSFYSLPPQT